MFIICIDETVKQHQEIDFIYESKVFEVNQALDLKRNPKLKGWKGKKTNI